MTVLLDALKKAAAEKKRQALLAAEGKSSEEGGSLLDGSKALSDSARAHKSPVTMSPSQARELSNLTQREDMKLNPSESSFSTEKMDKDVSPSQPSKKFSFASSDEPFAKSGDDVSIFARLSNEPEFLDAHEREEDQLAEPFAPEASSFGSTQGDALLKSLENSSELDGRTSSSDVSDFESPRHNENQRDLTSGFVEEKDVVSEPRQLQGDASPDDMLADGDELSESNRNSNRTSLYDSEKLISAYPEDMTPSNPEISESKEDDGSVTKSKLFDTQPSTSTGIDKASLERELNKRIARRTGAETKVSVGAEENGVNEFNQASTASEIASELPTRETNTQRSTMADQASDTSSINNQDVHDDSYNWSLSQIPGYQSADTEEQKRIHTKRMLESLASRPVQKRRSGKWTGLLLLFLVTVAVAYYGIHYYLHATKDVEADLQRYNIPSMDMDEVDARLRSEKPSSEKTAKNDIDKAEPGPKLSPEAVASRQLGNMDENSSGKALVGQTPPERLPKDSPQELGVQDKADSRNALNVNPSSPSVPSRELTKGNIQTQSDSERSSIEHKRASKSAAVTNEGISPSASTPRLLKQTDDKKYPKKSTSPAPPKGPVQTKNAIQDSPISQSRGVVSQDTTRGMGEDSPLGQPKLSIESTQSLATQAYQAYQNGDIVKAKHLYEDALAEDPNNINAMFGLAAIAVRSHQNGAATELYQAILRQSPSNLEAQKALVSLENRQKVTDANLDKLKNLAMQMPKDPQVQFAIGNHYAQKKDWLDAQKHFFKAYELSPNSPVIALNLAISLDRIGEYRLAKNYYEKSLSASKNSVESVNTQAIQQRLTVIDRFLKESP